MANEKQIRLIQRLSQKTSAGEVRWEATADENVFQAAFPSFGVRVEKFFNRWQDEEVRGYGVYVLNQEGTAVDELTDSSFTEANFGRSPFVQLQELFQGARRTALGADQALDALLNDLDGG